MTVPPRLKSVCLFLALLAAQFAFPSFLIWRQLDLLESGEVFKVRASVSAAWRDKNAFFVRPNIPPAKYRIPIVEFEKFIAESRAKLESCGSKVPKNFRWTCAGPDVWAALEKGDDGFLKIAYVGGMQGGGRKISYENRGRFYPVVSPLYSSYNLKNDSVHAGLRTAKFRVSEFARKSFEEDLKRLNRLRGAEREKSAYAVIRVKDGRWAISDVVVFGRSAAEADGRRRAGEGSRK